MSNTIIKGDARFSADKVHRYMLWRSWDDNKPKILFIGLNPSRADATKNDNTITRCINFAKSWGFGGLFFGNLYSFRTPYVTRKQVERATVIPGEQKWEPLIENLSIATDERTDLFLTTMIRSSAQVVCCWGSWSFIKGRAMYIIDQLIPQSYCFGLNQDGQPKHPLYLANSSELTIFSRIKTKS